MKKIVIIGGGFAGMTTAIQLSRMHLQDVAITLLTPRSYYDYYPGLFHLLTGYAAKQLAIPYEDILVGTGIQWEKATVTHVDISKKQISCADGSHLSYDYLALTCGSVMNFFDMEFAREYLHTVSTVDDVLELRRSIHETLTRCHFDKNHTPRAVEVVVIGGGPNGTESAAEAALLVQQVASSYQIDASQVGVNLYVSGDRVTPQFDPTVSKLLHEKLTEFGVTVTYNKRVTKEEMEQVLIPAIKRQEKLVVWSTGMKLSPLASCVVGLTQDKRGKVKVDEHLRAYLANGAVSKNVFVGGDLADTMYSGLAQTAHYDGHIIATNIAAMIYGAPLAKNTNTHRGCLVAMGREWSIWTKGKRHLSGKLIWHLRRLIDLKSYLQILPLRKALDIWLSEDEPWEEFDRVARERMEEKYRSK